MPGLRIVFMGTPSLACASLEALIAEPGFEIVAVVTQPDRPKGRDLKLTSPPVKDFALSRNLPVFQPEKARNPDFIETLRRLNPDLIAVAAYGQILPKAILDLPRYGCLNVHTSLLPKYRGAAPIQRAILNDEPETGVTIMKMDEGLDTGSILAQETTVIASADNAQTLHDRLAQLGGALLGETIPGYLAGKIKPHPQPKEGVTYAPKIKKEDGLVDWSKPARVIWNQVRGLVPWPVAHTFLPGKEKQLLKIWEAQVAAGSGTPGHVLQADKGGITVACGANALELRSLQKQGGRRMSAQEFLAGRSLTAGQSLLQS
jgi:methionyl-tRNA formyltransferase